MQSKSFSSPTLDHSQYYNAELGKTNQAVYIGKRFANDVAESLHNEHKFFIVRFDNLDRFDEYLSTCSIIDSPGIIIIEVYDESSVIYYAEKFRNNPLTSGAIIILLAQTASNEFINTALKAKVNDVYIYPFSAEMIAERIRFLIKFKLVKSSEEKAPENFTSYKIPFVKRALDIAVSSILLLILLPVFIIITILIRLESKGPIIYKSKRAGTGYKIFDFYKFRSMIVDADKKLEKLSKTNNQYGPESADGNQKAFVKILNDPRITKIGGFLRKTSIDELPQLINVLKGDMSLVGNRPLPLYEAEMLTSDQFAMRFLGPAGITGLWQISKRGKAEMSDTERKELDNHYAKYGSVWMDIKIMAKTLPALIQKEKV